VQHANANTSDQHEYARVNVNSLTARNRPAIVPWPHDVYCKTAILLFMLAQIVVGGGLGVILLPPPLSSKAIVISILTVIMLYSVVLISMLHV